MTGSKAKLNPVFGNWPLLKDLLSCFTGFDAWSGVVFPGCFYEISMVMLNFKQEM